MILCCFRSSLNATTLMRVRAWACAVMLGYPPSIGPLNRKFIVKSKEQRPTQCSHNGERDKPSLSSEELVVLARGLGLNRRVRSVCRYTCPSAQDAVLPLCRLIATSPQSLPQGSVTSCQSPIESLSREQAPPLTDTRVSLSLFLA